MTCLAGTELKRLLAAWPLRIEAVDGCPCNAHVAVMDSQGCDWVEENLELVVGWLREQAFIRGICFCDAAGRFLVRRAIRNARRRAYGCNAT